MVDIEIFSSMRRSWKALINGEIHVTNRTGHLLRIEVSYLDSEKVHNSPLGDGDTAQLVGHPFYSYLTVFAEVPTSSLLRAKGHLFKLVENARICRWHEYVFEKKHYENALAAHEKLSITSR